MTTCLITGAGGFVGSALARTLMAAGTFGRLLLTDRAPKPDWCPPDGARVVWQPGELHDPALLDALFSGRIDRVAHLAGVVSGAAEADFDLGWRVNVDATRALLARSVAQGRSGPPIRFVFASSIAVHGVPLDRKSTRLNSSHRT